MNGSSRLEKLVLQKCSRLFVLKKSIKFPVHKSRLLEIDYRFIDPEGSENPLVFLGEFSAILQVVSFLKVMGDLTEKMGQRNITENKTKKD